MVLSDVLTGLLLAVLLALVLVLYRASRPYIAQLGEFPERPGAYGDIARHPDYQPVPGMLIVRLDAPLYYFNANVATKQILQLVEIGSPAPKALLIDLGATADLDLTSAETFSELIREMRERSVEVYFAQVRGRVRDRVKRIGMSQDITEDHIYPTLDAAVKAFRAHEAAEAVQATVTRSGGTSGGRSRVNRGRPRMIGAALRHGRVRECTSTACARADLRVRPRMTPPRADRGPTRRSAPTPMHGVAAPTGRHEVGPYVTVARSASGRFIARQKCRMKTP